ncbi:unnamed protein product [Dicrocoelium dendriticum]|nr:unnamed protein product [Dicrocoelium dendriticum]
MTHWYTWSRCFEKCPAVFMTLIVLNAKSTLSVFLAPTSTFWIEENLPKGSLIGNLSHPVEISELKYRVYTELAQGKIARFFNVDPKDGTIYAEQNIDREALCENSVYPSNRESQSAVEVISSRNTYQQNTMLSDKNSPVKKSTLGTIDREEMDNTAQTISKSASCMVNFQVHVALTFTDGTTVNRIIDVHVMIADINDNSPQFSSPSTTLHVSESSPVGSEFRLPQAFDADPGYHGVVSYKIMRANSKVESKSGIMNCNLNSTEQPLRNSFFSMSVSRAGHTAEIMGNDHAFPFAGDYFILRTHKKLGGLIQPYLQQIHLLDREQHESLYFCLLAEDGGGRQGAMLGKIEVLDINDNVPQWLGLPFKVTVSECASQSMRDFGQPGNFHPDSVSGDILRLITTLHAEDKDSGRNGKISYRLSEKYMPGASQNLKNKPPAIIVRENQVLLASKLDYESVRQFLIPVEAVDGGGLVNVTEIEVVVEDCNDHAPIINVIPLNTIESVYFTSKRSRQTSDKTVLAVLEEDSKHIELATIIVHDLDENDNRHITCTLDPGAGAGPLSEMSTFGLDLLEPSGNSQSDLNRITTKPVIFTFYKREGATLNREVTSSLIVNILCSDNNVNSPHETRKLLNIKVVDANDNAPQVSRTDHRIDKQDVIITQTLHVVENEPIGTYIGSVYAVDADEGINAKLHYTFAKLNTAYPDQHEDGVKEATGAELFEMESSSGKVFTHAPLDRERNATFVCIVNVSDSGNPPLSSIVRLRIIVLDVNDSPPMFITTPGENGRILFSVNESVGKSHVHGRLVGQLQSTDADEGQNRSVIYELVEGLSIPKGLAVRYRVTPKGKIYADGIMDREQFPEHQFTVRAFDEAPIGHQLTSTAIVVVSLLDINDSPPTFVSPPSSGDSGLFTDVINVSARIPPGSVLYHIRATDLDEPRNTQLHFTIRSAKFLSDYFVLRPLNAHISGSNRITDSGAELILANSLNQLPTVNPGMHNESIFHEDLSHDLLAKEYFVYIIAKDSEIEPIHSCTARLRIHVYPDIRVDDAQIQVGSFVAVNKSTDPSTLHNTEIIGSHLLPMNYFQIEQDDTIPMERQGKASGMAMILTMSIVIVCIFLGLFCFVAIVYIRGNVLNSPSSLQTHEPSDRKRKLTKTTLGETPHDIGCDDAMSACDQAVYLELLNQRALSDGCRTATSPHCVSADSSLRRGEHACFCVAKPILPITDEYGAVPMHLSTAPQYDSRCAYSTFTKDAVYLAHACVPNKVKKDRIASSTEVNFYSDGERHGQSARNEDLDPSFIEISGQTLDRNLQEYQGKPRDFSVKPIGNVCQHHLRYMPGFCENDRELHQESCALYSSVHSKDNSQKPTMPSRDNELECIQIAKKMVDHDMESHVMHSISTLSRSPKQLFSRSVTFGNAVN